MAQKPIKFKPIIKSKIWGGQNLQTELGKDLQGLSNAGESWELSAVEGDVSVVANGPFEGRLFSDIITQLGAELVGEHVYKTFGTKFPLLIKFIDANDKLSVQVHPDEKMAKARNCGNGKSEMWYVVKADEGAQLVSGFSERITREQYKPLLESGHFLEKLASYNVQRGDVFYMPAGRIHAIGRGVMVAEIQQTSDTTYRVFDYNRRDAEGNLRQLHVEEACEAIHYDDFESGRKEYSLNINERVEVVDCQYFKTGIIKIEGTMHRDYTAIDSCVVIICVGGKATIASEPVSYGETLLVPASLKYVDISGQAELLEVFIP